MTALSFPLSPSVGTTYTAPNNTVYIYDGTKWNIQGTTITATDSVNFVQDSAALLFTNIQGNGITFSYDDRSNVLSATVTGYSGSGSAANIGNFTFDNSTMNIPVIGSGSEAYLKAGGNRPNSVQLRTSVNYMNTDINTSEIALEAGNGGFSAQVYGHYTGGANGSGGPTLVYAGVENVSGAHGPGFAGFISRDPALSSQYAVKLDNSNNIIIGATQENGTVTTTQYTAAIGTLNKDTGNMTGVLTTPDKLVLNNSNNAWVFDKHGVLNLPNNNGQIGQLEAPYTGLEFRTGSGADWIGISYGEIADDNTSYFYFDKDGSDYTTANHLAHLQIKNPAHNGHLEWLFDSTGTLTLPQNATIADTGNSVVIVPNTLASDFQLEIKAYQDIVTPDDIHIRANNTNYGLVIGDSNGGSFVNVNGNNNQNTVVISTINKNDEERKDFTFDVLGNLNVPGDVRVSAVGAFKNSAGIRAAYINEIPMDVSDLTDNMSLLPKDISPVEIAIDGGHALAFFAIPTNADGGGSAGRFGPNSIVFNGGGASGIYTNTLNGGGA